MPKRLLLLWVLLPLGCNGAGSEDEDDDGTESTEAAVPSGTVTGTATSQQATLDMVDGVAFANLREDGALWIRIFSFAEPGCDSDEWMWMALDQPAEYIMVTAGMVEWMDEPRVDLAMTWGDGQTSGTGTVWGDGTLTMSPDTPEGLTLGDTVTGELSYTADPKIGHGETVDLSYAVPYCGEMEPY